MTTAQELLARTIGVAAEFTRWRGTEEQGWWRLSTNASYLGGYSEALVATLFIDWRKIAADEGLDEAWRQATFLRTSSRRKPTPEELGKAWRGWRRDAIDLLIPPPRGSSFPFRASCVGPRYLRGVVADARRNERSLSVQVKSRVRRAAEYDNDALPYHYLLGSVADGQSRLALFEAGSRGAIWRDPSPDLYAWVEWDVTATKAGLVPNVRLATRHEVRLAVLAAEMRSAAKTAKARGDSQMFSKKKLSFDHVYGRLPCTAASLAEMEAVVAPACGTDYRGIREQGWRTWAVGANVTAAVADSPTVEEPGFAAERSFDR